VCVFPTLPVCVCVACHLRLCCVILSALLIVFFGLVIPEGGRVPGEWCASGIRYNEDDKMCNISDVVGLIQAQGPIATWGTQWGNGKMEDAIAMNNLDRGSCHSTNYSDPFCGDFYNEPLRVMFEVRSCVSLNLLRLCACVCMCASVWEGGVSSPIWFLPVCCGHCFCQNFPTGSPLNWTELAQRVPMVGQVSFVERYGFKDAVREAVQFIIDHPELQADTSCAGYVCAMLALLVLVGTASEWTTISPRYNAVVVIDGGHCITITHTTWHCVATNAAGASPLRSLQRS